jgi:hypothetical protein
VTEAEVVQTESGKEVRMPYRRGCRGYTLGVASAIFWLTTLLGFVILYKRHVPNSIYHVSASFFVVYSFAGFAIVGIAYTNPIWFYELMEGDG